MRSSTTTLFVVWAILPVTVCSALAAAGTQDWRVAGISLVPVSACCLLAIFCPKQPVWRLCALHTTGFAAGAVAACHVIAAVMEPAFLSAAEVFESGLTLQAVFGVVDSAFFTTRLVLGSGKRFVQFDFERCVLAAGSGFGLVWLPLAWNHPAVFLLMPVISVIAAWLICATWVALPPDDDTGDEA